MSKTMQSAVADAFGHWLEMYRKKEQIVFDRESKRHMFDAFEAGFNGGEITGISIGRQLEKGGE